MNGKPEQVYKTHSINKCHYQLKMVKYEIGDFSSKAKVQQDYKKEMKSMKTKVKELSKFQKELKLHSKDKKKRK